MSLNDDVVEIENCDGACLPNTIAGQLSGLFLHPSIFLIKVSRSA